MRRALSAPCGPSHGVDTLQRLPYFLGVCGQTVGAQGLAMHLARDPAGCAGAAAQPSRRRGERDLCDRGPGGTRRGEGLAQSVLSEAGDFLFIPPDVPHEAVNPSTTEPARAIVARKDAAEQDEVEAYTP
jgi:uncharacterized RmlC-like cupin family protein